MLILKVPSPSVTKDHVSLIWGLMLSYLVRKVLFWGMPSSSKKWSPGALPLASVPAMYHMPRQGGTTAWLAQPVPRHTLGISQWLRKTIGSLKLRLYNSIETNG